MSGPAFLRIALISGAALAVFASPACADESGWGAGVETVNDSELSDMRGGFRIPGTDIDVNLGAVVTTMMNGAPVLTTNVTWTDAGSIIDQTITDVGQSLSDLSPAELEALGLAGLEGAGGIVIEDAAGVTALVHNVAEGALQNIIVNSAMGRSITQDVDVTLTLPGFDAVQESLTIDHFGIQIHDDLTRFLN